MKIKKLNEGVQTSDASKINPNYIQTINKLDGGVERFAFYSNLPFFVFRRKLNLPQAESGGTLWVRVCIDAGVFVSSIFWNGDDIDQLDIQPIQNVVDQAKKQPVSEKNIKNYKGNNSSMIAYYPGYKQKLLELLQNNRAEIEELVNYCYDGLVECLKNFDKWPLAMRSEFWDYIQYTNSRAHYNPYFKLDSETDNLEDNIMKIKRLNEEELKSGKELAQKDIDELGRLAGNMQDCFAHISDINYKHPDEFLKELLKIYSEDNNFVQVIANLCAKEDPWDTI